VRLNSVYNDKKRALSWPISATTERDINDVPPVLLDFSTGQLLPLAGAASIDIEDALLEAISIAREPGGQIVGIACDDEPLLEEIAE